MVPNIKSITINDVHCFWFTGSVQSSEHLRHHTQQFVSNKSNAEKWQKQESKDSGCNIFFLKDIFIEATTRMDTQNC